MTATAEKRIVYQSLDSLIAAKNVTNAKDHDLGAIIESIRRFGFVSPIIFDTHDQVIVAGHGRVDALAALFRENPDLPPVGIHWEKHLWFVPTVADDLFEDEDERDAYTIADNRLVTLGGWQTAQLVETLNRVQSSTEDGLKGTGFDGDDLDAFVRMLSGDESASPDQGEPVGGSYASPDRYGVTVNVRSLMEEDEMAAMLEAYGYTVKRHSQP